MRWKSSLKGEEPKIKKSQQELFQDNRKNYSDKDIQLELLFTQRLLLDTQRQLLKMTDKVRGNTNTLIWWLIVMPIIFTIIAYTLYENAMMTY